MKVLTVPNLLTFLRLILIPVFVTSLVYKSYLSALSLFIAAGLTDALDGLLARLTDQKSQLGAFLDPLADKFLLVTSFVLFSFYGWIPMWVTITVISRDIIITLGWIILYLIHHTTMVRPSLAGKMASAAQVILVTYVLLSINFSAVPAPADWMLGTVAALTIVSGLHYIYRAMKHANEV